MKIQQHEYAVSWPGDPSAPILGSEDATTCHIIVLRHPQSGVTSLTHADVMDGKSIDRIRDDMLELAKDKLGRKGGKEITYKKYYFLF